MRAPVWLCFVFLVVAFPSIGQIPSTLSSASNRLDDQIQVLIDTTGGLSFSQILETHAQSRFFVKGDLVFGYLAAPIWLKFKVRNPDPQKVWYVDIPAPFLEYVDFYQLLPDSSWQHLQAGYYRKQSVRPLPHTSHVFPLVFNNNGEATCYIQITGSSPKTFPVYVLEREYFYEKTRLEDVGYGLFFGILAAMFFFNLFLYSSLRHIVYLLYVGTIICTIAIFLGASGYGGKFLWPEHPMLNFYAGRMPLGPLAVMIALFAIYFLQVKKYSKVMYYLLLSLILLGPVAMLLVATGAMSSAGNNLITVSILIYITCGIVCRLRGNPTATYFIAAWAIYFVGGLLLTLRNSGFFDFNFWTTHFVEIGATLETVIIAFALADRYRRLKREKEQAQQQVIDLQRQTNEQLESKVAERTEQLVAANTELQAMLETNQLQTKIIEDKNTELDAFFYRISHDLKGPIASLIGLASLAKAEVNDAKAKEYFGMQLQQTKRLNAIVNSLSDLTRLNNERPFYEKIDFTKLVADCIASLNAVPNFEKVSFERDIRVGSDFHSEWALMTAIVQNLVENAVKYGHPHTPVVRIAVRSHNQQLVIEVEDNGNGIAEEHRDKIFELFYRANKQATGSGLGLYILKRSVEKLRGTVQLSSELNRGSTFTITLPHH
ncbi:MAG: sensor histidine kinase [Bacteroidia bacterium]|nr:sensor histidine kinase [Bacteroidia bacterium]